MKKYQKALIGIVLSLFIFGFINVNTAKAITVEEIRAQIVIILAKIVEIQKQLQELIDSENAAAVKSVVLSSPYGGEKWEAGKTYEIKWNTTGYPSDSKVKIDVLDDRKQSYEVGYELNIAETANTGSYSWTIPSSLEGSGLYGSLYKVALYIGEGNDKKSAVSGTYFTISQGVPAYLNLVSPIGGEIWQVGKTYTIKWDSLGMENSKIDIVLKYFETEYLVIANHIANTSYYNWQIPQGLYGSGYKIMLRAYDQYGTPSTPSSGDNNFTIMQATSSKNMEQQLASLTQAVADLLGKVGEFIAR